MIRICVNNWVSLNLVLVQCITIRVQIFPSFHLDRQTANGDILGAAGRHNESGPNNR